MSAKLILSRKGEFLNRRKAYSVLIDGKPMGTIESGKSLEYVLEPGYHTVQCKYNWMSSAEKSFSIADDKNVYLQVSNGMKYFLPLYILLFIGLLLPSFFRIARVVLPETSSIIQIILIFPALIYMFTYFTFYRKKYLTISEDHTNPFA